MNLSNSTSSTICLHLVIDFQQIIKKYCKAISHSTNHGFQINAIHNS